MIVPPSLEGNATQRFEARPYMTGERRKSCRPARPLASPAGIRHLDHYDGGEARGHSGAVSCLPGAFFDLLTAFELGGAGLVRPEAVGLDRPVRLIGRYDDAARRDLVLDHA